MKPRVKLKVGVIGLGGQALGDHIPAIQESMDVELSGVVDINRKKVQDFLKENKKVKGYNNFDDFLKEQKPDFIVLAVPHCLHCQITIKAIKNKIHVLKEKPFATSIKEVQKIKELADKNNTVVMVTLQRRFNPIYSTFLQLIDKIGNPFYIEGKYTFFTDKPYEGWRGKKELAGGGCLIDMGYHIIDLLIWYFGLPDNVFAQTSHRAKENIDYNTEDTARVMFKYQEKNLWGSLLVSRVIPPKQEYLSVYGTRGSIHLERGKIERYTPDGKMQESLQRENSWPSAAQDQIEYFVKVIHKEKENISSPEFHLNHLAFIEAAYKSKEKHQYINPKEFLVL